MPIGEATLEQWRRIVDLNLWGVIYGIHAALPIMRRQGGGHLVNTASVAGLVPFPYQSLYCTTKFGIVGLSEALRYELAADGIRVSVVCPGNVATRIFETSLMGDPVAGRAPDDSITADEAARTILDAVAAGEGIIAFPEGPKHLWDVYRTAPEQVAEYMLGLADQRRSAYATDDAEALFRPRRLGDG